MQLRISFLFYFLTLCSILSTALSAQALENRKYKESIDIWRSSVDKEPIGKIHFDPEILRVYGLSGQAIAESAGSIMRFHTDVWEYDNPMFWDIYLVGKREDGTANLGATTLSATKKVAGASHPGPTNCVSQLVLLNIDGVENLYEDIQSNLDFVMAHEASHCFQRLTSKLYRETINYKFSNWFMEGSATWLAGDYMESTGRKYPSWGESRFLENHKKNMLTFDHQLSNINHFFFKWLEGKQALNSRAQVVRLVRDMLEVPLLSECVLYIDVEKFPDQRDKNDNAEVCSNQNSPYENSVKKWFERQNSNFAKVLSLFASALVRGNVPGIKNPNLFLNKVTINLLPGFEEDVYKTQPIHTLGIPLPIPIGKVCVISQCDDPKKSLPESFGFVIFEVALSDELSPPPRGYQIAMEGGDDDVRGYLSNIKTDDEIDQSGWIQIKTLGGHWISFARTDSEKGSGTMVLLRVQKY